MGLTTYRIERQGADRLLVLLHGWSAEQHHLAAYVPLVDPGERFSAVCPRAPHDLPDGDGASWYDRSPEGPDAGSFAEALDTLDAFVVQECERVGIAPERCVVAGFSQGGFLALALAGRSGAPRYAAVWAMCCGMPDVEGLELDFGHDDGRPALLQAGRHDAIIAPERTTAAADVLGDAGWEVTLRDYDMAHSQTIEMMIDARAWLDTLLRP
ncbi:MAG: alpha/beta hydrolase [Acidimicrobiales bacterium]